MKPISMKIDKSKVHRISIADGKRVLVNLVYAEFGEVDYEVLGVFSGETCGGGIFHQNSEGDITISDDPGELESSIEVQDQFGHWKRVTKCVNTPTSIKHKLDWALKQQLASKSKKARAVDDKTGALIDMAFG